MAFGASEAARWQACQTRARMGAHLWFQIITIAVLSWVVLTLYVVWRQTGVFYPQLDHQYFWYWVFCGIIIDTPLLQQRGTANLGAPDRPQHPEHTPPLTRLRSLARRMVSTTHGSRF
jgi:hypothetical protein